MRKHLARFSLVALAGAAFLPATAQAFCGFYVAGSESALHNEATTVVLMREGTRTVLSMQNDYAGPPEDFAMVVPVPVVLQRDDVRTLDRTLFERVERLTGPRLVEYWEQDPCNRAGMGLGGLGTIGFGGSGSGYGSGAGGRQAFVHVEAQFAVGEYDIVVLGTNDSSALDTWLREHRYHIPAGAAEALRPYVESGMKFFVARVNVERVRFASGRAVLSPLRVSYESEQLALPVRLGLLNSAGTQDLVVTVIARNVRYEVANYPNVFIPTNLDLSNDARTHFGDFYSALFDRTLAQNPGAVVTEYAWQATSCDPCPPDATLDERSLTTLGGDVLYRDGVQPSAGWGGRGSGGLGGPALVQVRMGQPRVEGRLSAEAVRRVMRRHILEARFCAEQDVFRGGSATGDAMLNFTIRSDGAVTASALEGLRGSELGSGLAACLSTAVRRWTFPASDDGNEVVVHSPIEFRGPSRDEAANGSLPTASADEFVVTRMHYRYGAGGLREDLVFRAAPPVSGGREEFTGAAQSQAATPSGTNNFQARYVIRHPWEGAVECANPVRNQWGGAPSGHTEVAVAPTHGPRSALQLETMLVSTLAGHAASPAAAATPNPAPVPNVTAQAPSVAPGASPGRPPVTSPAPSLCASRPAGRASSWFAISLVAAGLAIARRRPTR